MAGLTDDGAGGSLGRNEPSHLVVDGAGIKTKVNGSTIGAAFAAEADAGIGAASGHAAAGGHFILPAADTNEIAAVEFTPDDAGDVAALPEFGRPDRGCRCLAWAANSSRPRAAEPGELYLYRRDVEENGKGAGRIRLRHVKDVSGASLLPFVQSAAVPGRCDPHRRLGWVFRLTAAGYKHELTGVSASPDPAHLAMPCVHNIAALLKWRLLGTHPGGVQHVHLDYCLDEFAVRVNRRRSKARGLLFHRLAQQTVNVGLATLTTSPAPLSLAARPTHRSDEDYPIGKKASGAEAGRTCASRPIGPTKSGFKP